MARTLLQDMVEGKHYESLPAKWSSFDLKSFSRQKQLWDYQQQAVASAVAGLWKYYEDFGDYERGKSPLNSGRGQVIDMPILLVTVPVSLCALKPA